MGTIGLGCFDVATDMGWSIQRAYLAFVIRFLVVLGASGGTWVLFRHNLIHLECGNSFPL